MTQATAEIDTERPDLPPAGDPPSLQWIEDEFPDSGMMADGIRSLARAAYQAPPEHRRTAFHLSAREAAGHAGTANIPIVRIVDLFAAVAERNGLAAELGQDGLQFVLAQAVARSDMGDRQGGAGSGSLAGLEPPPPLEPDPAWQTPPGANLPPPQPLFRPVPIDLVHVGDEPQWLVGGLVPARGLVAMIGPPKCGKSYLTTDMLFSVARGEPYAGRDVLQGPVVYLTGEGVQGFKRRLITMRRHYKAEGKGFDFFMVDNVPDLGSERTNLPAMLAEIDEFLERYDIDQPRAIALDTLARCMGEGDESSARDMGRFIIRCGEIERHYGCVVVVVHHMGKDATRGARGSNALNGAADVTITVDKGEAFSTARVDEMKDGPEGQEWRFHLLPYQPGEDEIELEKRNTLDPPATVAQQSTCIVELLSEISGAQQSATVKERMPRGVAGDLLKIIRLAIEETGQTNPPDTTLVPRNVRAASRENLKNYCKIKDWNDPEGKPHSFRTLLGRHLSGLRGGEHIGYSADWIWLT
jgi:AAA domain